MPRAPANEPAVLVTADVVRPGCQNCTSAVAVPGPGRPRSCTSPVALSSATLLRSRVPSRQVLCVSFLPVCDRPVGVPEGAPGSRWSALPDVRPACLPLSPGSQGDQPDRSARTQVSISAADH